MYICMGLCMDVCIWISLFTCQCVSVYSTEAQIQVSFMFRVVVLNTLVLNKTIKFLLCLISFC